MLYRMIIGKAEELCPSSRAVKPKKDSERSYRHCFWTIIIAGCNLVGTTGELSRTIKRLVLRKAPGPDIILNEIDRLVNEYDPTALPDTYNLCLREGGLPIGLETRETCAACAVLERWQTA